MEIKLDHVNFNVTDLQRSMEFYRRAFGLEEVGNRIHPESDAFEIAFMGDGKTAFRIELTCLHDKVGAYNLGDNETHLAFRTADFDELHALHREMGCICYENEKMGVYFVVDPDGYWIEVTPVR